jgi:hypothetical protein
MTVRPVELLVGTRAIARFLKVGNDRVLAMERQGAPIARDVTGTLRAEKAALWEWFSGLCARGVRPRGYPTT